MCVCIYIYIYNIEKDECFLFLHVILVYLINNLLIYQIKKI